jgi:hypothetical protein
VIGNEKRRAGLRNVFCALDANAKQQSRRTPKNKTDETERHHWLFQCHEVFPLDLWCQLIYSNPRPFSAVSGPLKWTLIAR